LIHAEVIPYVFLSEAHSSASYVHASLMDTKARALLVFLYVFARNILEVYAGVKGRPHPGNL